ncbi:MAG TPA: MFS transporter [Bryobacteraceae bacterium]|nr:MFS transporter [Bryobacteraceae bacterium]
MGKIKGTPAQGLAGATLGFFIGFAAVALFGPTAAKFQQVMYLSPMAVGFLVAMPSLSGSLLRIPFSAWVDTTGGRKPFLVLLTLSMIGMAGLAAVVSFLYPTRLTASYYPLLLLLAILCGCGIATFSVGISQVSYWFSKKAQGSALAVFGGVGNIAPGIFSMLIPMALGTMGLTNSYLIWLGMLTTGTAAYFLAGRNSPYFQLRAQGMDVAEARYTAATHGQVLFPAGSLKDSLSASARVWRTWALVMIYFTTFGGFIALTAWFPTYWTANFGMTPIQAGMLTALYSVLTSLIRILGGVVSDKLREGGENTAILALFIVLMGALVMIGARDYQLAIPGEILLAFGMGICNAAVFKMVPQAVPKAVGGAAGWVGGLGAFGGFAIPPMLAFAVRDLGTPGYSIGFIVYLFLALTSLFMAWILKYSEAPAGQASGLPAEKVAA